MKLLSWFVFIERWRQRRSLMNERRLVLFSFLLVGYGRWHRQWLRRKEENENKKPINLMNQQRERVNCFSSCLSGCLSFILKKWKRRQSEQEEKTMNGAPSSPAARQANISFQLNPRHLFSSIAEQRGACWPKGIASSIKNKVFALRSDWLCVFRPMPLTNHLLCSSFSLLMNKKRD